MLLTPRRSSFQLDFTGCLFGKEFLKNTEKMFDLNAELYALPKEELNEYAYNPPISLFRYCLFYNLFLLILNAFESPKSFD